MHAWVRVHAWVAGALRGVAGVPFAAVRPPGPCAGLDFAGVPMPACVGRFYLARCEGEGSRRAAACGCGALRVWANQPPHTHPVRVLLPQVRRKFRQKDGVSDDTGPELVPSLLNKVLGKRKGAPSGVADD
jgi:hypothetical protein